MQASPSTCKVLTIALMKKVADIEKTIVVKEHERARYDFDPTMFYENRFWNQRPDGIVINKYFEQIELQAKLLNYFLGSNKSNINQSSNNIHPRVQTVI